MSRAIKDQDSHDFEEENEQQQFKWKHKARFRAVLEEIRKFKWRRKKREKPDEKDSLRPTPNPPEESSDIEGNQSVLKVLDVNENEKTVLQCKGNLTTEQKTNEEIKPNFRGVKCKTILVSGLPLDVTEDEITIYFQSKASGGGDVDEVFWDKEQHRAVVTFDEYEDVESVISREHVLGDYKLSVEKYPSTSFSISLETSLVNVTDEALPRLSDELLTFNALCAKEKSQKELTVTCPTEDHDRAWKTLNEFLEQFREEERRKNIRTEEVEDINQKKLLFLQGTGFFEKMKADYPEIEFQVDTEQGRVSCTGPDDEVGNALKKYKEVITQTTKKSLVLGRPSAWNILTHNQWRKYFAEKLAKENIEAKTWTEESDSHKSVTIVAASHEECKRAEEIVNGSIITKSLSFPLHAAHVVESEKFQELQLKLQENLVTIWIDKTQCLIELFGVQEIVDAAEREMEDFLKVSQIQTGSVMIDSKSVASFVRCHLSSEIKNIEQDLKEENVSIDMDAKNENFVMKGTKKGISKCEERLKELLSNFVEKDESISSPGLSSLILGDYGQNKLKAIEQEKKVNIEIKTCRTQAAKQPTSRKISRSISSLERFTGKNIFKQCNFTTKEGVRISCKYGNIEDEKADVLVNFAHQNINERTACSEALAGVGGPSFIDACKPHTNVPKGDIVCTISGNLPSDYVIHAVCDNGDKKLLQQLIKKILSKCIDLRANSLALPTFGTDQHGISEEVFLDIFKKTVKKMSAKVIEPSDHCLKDIRVIVHGAFKKSNLRRSMPVLPRDNLLPRFLRINRSTSAIEPLVGKTANSGNPAICFGSVRVFLFEGDITKHPADGVINVISRDLRLASGGGASNSILKSGGHKIQEELDESGNCQLGSVIVTSAGSMTNTKKILHFLPRTTDVPGLESSIKDCLDNAKQLGLRSVSIPAIGTSNFKISAASSAGLILNAAESFTETCIYQLDIHIVVFQNSMLPDFENVLHKKGEEIEAPLSKSKSFSATSTQAQNTSGQDEVLCIGKETVVTFHFVGQSLQDINDALEKVKVFIERNKVKKVVQNEKINEVIQKHQTEIDQLARRRDVLIEYPTTGEVSIKGMAESVSDCKDELLKMTKKYEEDDSRQKLQLLSQLVQWSFLDGVNSQNYAQ